MVWTGAIGLRWFRICCNFGNCSGACAVKVDRFRIGRVEQARMGCIVLSIEVGARSAGLLFRVARHIRVHGREQHRVHERDSVHGGKSFPMAYLFKASFVMIALFVQAHQLAVNDPDNVGRRHLRIETIHQRHIVGIQDALRLLSFVHCLSQVRHMSYRARACADGSGVCESRPPFAARSGSTTIPPRSCLLRNAVRQFFGYKELRPFKRRSNVLRHNDSTALDR
jgi:hypothetical protein